MLLKAKINDLFYNKIMITCIFAVCVLCFGLSYLTQQFLKNEFKNKNQELFQSILEYIVNTEKNADQLLKSSLIEWSGILQNKDNLNIEQMRLDKNAFSVTSLAILDKDGIETKYDTELDFEDKETLMSSTKIINIIFVSLKTHVKNIVIYKIQN